MTKAETAMISRRADRNLSPCFLDRLGDTIRIQCVFRGSLKKSGLLRVFAYASKPKNARCPAFSILLAKNLRPQAAKFLLLSRRRKPQGPAPCYDRQCRKRQKGSACGASYSDGIAYAIMGKHRSLEKERQKSRADY